MISLPVHVMRGFRNVGNETGLLLALVGGNDPGRVGWPEEMKRMARAAGVELTDDGNFRELVASR